MNMWSKTVNDKNYRLMCGRVGCHKNTVIQETNVVQVNVNVNVSASVYHV